MIPISGEHVLFRAGTRTVYGIMPSEKNINRLKKVQSADGSAVNLNWKQTIESLQHPLRWFSFRARDERNYL
jgi:hypothetical protein